MPQYRIKTDFPKIIFSKSPLPKIKTDNQVYLIIFFRKVEPTNTKIKRQILLVVLNFLNT